MIFDSGNQFLSTLQRLEKKMDALNQRLQQVQNELQAEATRVNNDLADRDNQIATLKTQIQQLQDQLSGVKLPDDAATTFDQIDQTINGIDPIKPVEVPQVTNAATPTGPQPAK